MCCMRAFCLLVSYSRWLSKKKNRIGESRWNCTTRRLSKAMLSQRVRFTTLDVAAMADDDTTPIALRAEKQSKKAKCKPRVWWQDWRAVRPHKSNAHYVNWFLTTLARKTRQNPQTMNSS